MVQFPEINSLNWYYPLAGYLQTAHKADGSLKIARSITDDGAVCNGTTDDIASIQTTITTVQNAGGGTVIVPGLSMISSTLAVTADNVQFVGMGWNCGFIAKSTFGANPMIWFKYPGGSNFRYGAVVRDLFLNGNNVSGIIGIELESTYHALIDHCRIRYCSGGNAIYCFGNSSARGAYTCIRDCALTDGGAGTAVFTAYHENSVIRGGLIAWWNSSGGIGFEPQDSDWIVEGVHFDECNTSVQLQFCTGAIIKGCSFDRGYTNFINVNGSVNAQIIANSFNNRAGSGTDMIQMQNSSTKACLVAENIALAGTSWTNFIKEQSGIGTPVSTYVNNDAGGLAVVRQNGAFRERLGYNSIDLPYGMPLTLWSDGHSTAVTQLNPDGNGSIVSKGSLQVGDTDNVNIFHDGTNATMSTNHGDILLQPETGKSIKLVSSNGSAEIDTYGNVYLNPGGLNTSGLYLTASSSPNSLSSSGTIVVLGIADVVVAPASNVSGVILQRGFAGQFSIVVNASNYSIQFAASITSNVANGASEVIPPNSARVYWFDSANNLWYGVSSIGEESASAAATATNGTITTSGVEEARIAPTGNITGVILQAGTYATQRCMVVNESAFTVTFAAVGTSNVADGTLAVIIANRMMSFVWDSAQAKWYHS